MSKLDEETFAGISMRAFVTHDENGLPETVVLGKEDGDRELGEAAARRILGSEAEFKGLDEDGRSVWARVVSR